MDFNPLPPHGGRLGISLTQKLCKIFQSTPSAWRETSDAQERLDDISISIHSLRMEGDNISDGRCVEEWEISIHSLRMEGDDPELVILNKID